MCHWCFSSGLVWIFAMSTIFCQGTSPRSLEELLRQHHVELTKDSLLNALKSSDAEVRDLAANKLAADRAEDSIPAIAEALASERVPGARINIAFALAQLGGDAGSAALNKACNDSELPGGLRARATIYQLQLHREDCLKAVLEMLRSREDPDLSRTTVLSLVPQFQHASKEDSDAMFDLVVKFLADDAPAVRLEAGNVLATLGKPAGIAPLQRAIANEQDEVVRSQLQIDLHALQEKNAGAGRFGQARACLGIVGPGDKTQTCST